MPTITIRCNDEEKKAFDRYAKFQGVPVSTLLKRSLKEKIEDEIDLQSILEYKEKVKNNTLELCSHEEMKKELGI